MDNPVSYAIPSTHGTRVVSLTLNLIYNTVTFVVVTCVKKDYVAAA